MRIAVALLTIFFLASCGSTSAVIDASLSDVIGRLDRLYPEPTGLTPVEVQRISAYRGSAAAYELEVSRPSVTSDQPYVLRIEQSQKLYKWECEIAVESISPHQSKLTIDVHDWDYFRLFNKQRRNIGSQLARLREIENSHSQSLQLTSDSRE